MAGFSKLRDWNEMETLVRYLQVQNDSIRTIMLQPDDKLSPETYHQLRVSIKKVDALAQLAKDSCKCLPKGKYLEKIKYIFKQAGKVRELQIQKDYLTESAYAEILSGLILSLTANLESAKRNFIDLKQASLGLRSMKPTKLKDCLLELSKNDAEKYLATRGKKVMKKIKSGKLKNNQVHILRKELKTMHYVRKASKIKKGEEPLLASSKNLSELIGQWHDARVLSEQFKTAFSLNNPSQQQRAALSEIRVNIKNQARSKFRKIEKTIRKL